MLGHICQTTNQTSRKSTGFLTDRLDILCQNCWESLLSQSTFQFVDRASDQPHAALTKEHILLSVFAALCQTWRLTAGSGSVSAHTAEKRVPKGDVVITANNRSIIVKCAGCHFQQLHVRISNAARQIITLSKWLIDTFKGFADSDVLEVAN